jgi:hypothetical protein
MATQITGSSEISNVPRLKDADSYPLWLYHLKILCSAQDLSGVIDGTEPVPSGENAADQIKKWKTRDSKAQHYIVMTIDKHITPHIINCKTSNEMFDTLKYIYKRDSEYQKCKLLKKVLQFSI